MNVSVIGLGKLGLCTAACFAARGHRVLGYDRSPRIVEALKSGRCPLDEAGLEPLLSEAGDRLSIASDLEEAVLGSDITLIIVPTPSEPDGRFSNRFVLEVLEAAAPALARKPGFHVVDVVSTVMPGSSAGVFKPLLEKLTGKTCGRDFGLVYNPEFIALGSVVRDFLSPDLVLIGASDERSAALVSDLYLSTCDNRPQVKTMSLVNAEIAKISLNCFVTMKISFANELTALCEAVPGADVDSITDALGADSRVGSKYLKGGLGFGGPCFPRDNLAFQAFAKETGSGGGLASAVVSINDRVVERFVRQVRDCAPSGGKVALLGLSYKPGTHIVEGSQSILLARKLVDEGFSVSVHDPKALASAAERLGSGVACREDPYSCASGAAAVVLLTDWPLYRQLDWSRLAQSALPGAVLIDSWRITRGMNIEGMRVVSLGIGPSL